MSNPDSFIEEVTEEVRRDRLFAFIRRWGWVAILAVVLIVGTAGYSEWRNARDAARAQAFGDALSAALDAGDAEARAQALAAIEPATPTATAILALLSAGETVAGSPEAAAERLRALAEAQDLPPRYRDLALLRAQILDPRPLAEIGGELDALAQPGRPYRALATEQLALAHLAAGEVETAIRILQEIGIDSSATETLRQRADQIVLALEAGATLVDASAPDPQTAAPSGEEGPAAEPQPEAAPEPEDGAGSDGQAAAGPDGEGTDGGG